MATSKNLQTRRATLARRLSAADAKVQMCLATLLDAATKRQTIETEIMYLDRQLDSMIDFQLEQFKVDSDADTM